MTTSSRRYHPAHATLVAACCAIFAAANWLKLGSFWGDPARSLFEFYRASLGEAPYRDFSFPYPPLTVWLISPMLRLFGASFAVAQIAYDLLSLGCVLSVWVLVRRILPPAAALLTVLAFIVASANAGGFALFTLGAYTPSILVAFAGVVLSSAGFVDAIRGEVHGKTAVLLAAGGFLACMGRPEAAGGVAAGMICVAVGDWRSGATNGILARRWLRMAALLFGPSALCYAALFVRIGRPLIEGVTAYGMASLACPWWPTGFGALSAVAALGLAVAVMGLVEGAESLRSGRPTLSLSRIAVAVAGAAVWAAFVLAYFRELTRFQSIHHGPLAVATFLISPQVFVQPVLWLTVILFLVDAASLIRGKSAATVEDRIRVALFGILVSLSLRGLFNSPLSNAPESPAVLQGYVFTVFPLVALRAAKLWSKVWTRETSVQAAERVFVAAGLLLCLYAGGRLLGNAVKNFNHGYTEIRTVAGPVRVNDSGVSESFYKFLEKNTRPGEPIADVGYGGGLNFALHRRSPLFTTQFVNFVPSEAQQRRDADQLNESGAPFVVLLEPPQILRSGTGFGCAFPRLAWTAEESDEASRRTLSVLRPIQEHYQPVQQFGNVVGYMRARE